MSRISTFRITVVAITLLLVLAAVGSTVGSASYPGPTTSSIDRASVVDGTATIENVRKLPPPEGSVKQVPADPNKQPQACVEPVVNVSQRTGNESESFVVINPTNPDNIVAFSNLASASSIFRGYSTDGGATWTRGTVATGVACCDGQAACWCRDASGYGRVEGSPRTGQAVSG